jgi:hypothetical protein
VTGAGSPRITRSAAGIQAILQATTNAMLVIGNDTGIIDFNDRFVAAARWGCRRAVPARVPRTLTDRRGARLHRVES